MGMEIHIFICGLQILLFYVNPGFSLKALLEKLSLCWKNTSYEEMLQSVFQIANEKLL